MRGKAWVAAHLFSRLQGPDDVRAWLRRLRAGTVQEIEGIAFAPLLLEGAYAPRDVLASEALAAGTLLLGEVGGGVVSRLRARNAGTAPVLILEGDVVVGGKQNRMVVRSVLLPEGREIPIPVGCVESGRWDAGRQGFGMAPSKAEPMLRSASWEESRRSPTRDLHQGRLWQDVDGRLRGSGAVNATSSYLGALERLVQESSRVLDRLVPVREQVGVLVTRGDRVIGAEITGHPDVWNHLAPRALPPLARAGLQAVPGGTAPGTGEEVLARIAASQLAIAPALGSGKELSLADQGLTGHGLWADGSVRHLAVVGR